MHQTLNPTAVATKYIREVEEQLKKLAGKIRVRGFVANEDTPSMSYAKATRQKFIEVGIDYDLVQLPRLALEEAIADANQNPDIHGLFVYLPVFNNEQDVLLRNLVDFKKDIEGGCQFWTSKLYANQRLIAVGDDYKKALLPCTPLAIIKMLTEAGIYDSITEKPVSDLIVTIFNRSEVVGRPLAAMLSNDGARVYSFDINGPLLFVDGKPHELAISRQEALATSDIVITGVPSEHFEIITPEEVKPGCTCVNFSYYPNISEHITNNAALYIPRIGPVTVAMCLRNTLRLYESFHQGQDNAS